VRARAMGHRPAGEPQITTQEDYYSASLKMLVSLAK